MTPPRVPMETDLPAPRLRGKLESDDSVPEGTSFWWSVRGYRQEARFLPDICECDVPLIGKEKTANRWTCRRCAGKVPH